MDKETVSQDIGDQLFDTETALETAMGKAAKLIEAVLCGRGQLGLSVTADQGSVKRLTAALALMGDARTEVVAAHMRLDRIRTDIGAATLGGGGYKPPQVMPEIGSFMRQTEPDEAIG